MKADFIEKELLLESVAVATVGEKNKLIIITSASSGIHLCILSKKGYFTV